MPADELQKHAGIEPEPPHSRAADTVIATLEQEILIGELPAGSPLPAERDLMKRFSSSRTVVREAIAALSSRGLVESKPRFRPIIEKPSYIGVLNTMSHVIGPLLAQDGGVKNLYECRVFLERALVRDAATSARRDDIHDLREALHANELAIDDSAKFYATDIIFHSILYRIPNNPIFPALQKGFVS